jgi:hypothetical protein
LAEALLDLPADRVDQTFVLRRLARVTVLLDVWQALMYMWLLLLCSSISVEVAQTAFRVHYAHGGLTERGAIKLTSLEYLMADSSTVLPLDDR